jgi:hypothetical protein
VRFARMVPLDAEVLRVLKFGRASVNGFQGRRI